MAPHREQGFILIALMITMVVIAVLIAALVSIKVTKNLSKPLYVNSTQAFYIAQSGAEFGMRYATENISAFCADPVGFISAIGTKSFGNGTFMLSFDNANNRLTSVAQAGAARRSIRIDSFRQFLPLIVLDPANPPYRSGGTQYIPFISYASCTVQITTMDIAKEGNPLARTREISLDATLVWSGAFTDISQNHNSPTPFNTTDFNIASGQHIESIRLFGASDVPGTWYITLYFRDCSNNPTSVTLVFIMT